MEGSLDSALPTPSVLRRDPAQPLQRRRSRRFRMKSPPVILGHASGYHRGVPSDDGGVPAISFGSTVDVCSGNFQDNPRSAVHCPRTECVISCALHNAKGRIDNTARASKGISPEQDNTPTSALGRYTGSGRDHIRHRHHYRRRKDPVWRRRRKSRHRQYRSLRSLVQLRCWLCIRYRGFRIALVEALGSPTVSSDSRRNNCRVHRVRNPRCSWWRVRDENGRCNDHS